MDTELLCRWLSLPAQCWPPDPHALLGLQPGQNDPETIERNVHDRLSKLRSYQICHPEEATEGMNRLAQAFLAVMERPKGAKRPERPKVASTSPANSSGTQSAPATVAPAVASTAQAPSGSPGVIPAEGNGLDWRSAPPPVRPVPDGQPSNPPKTAKPLPTSETQPEELVTFVPVPNSEAAPKLMASTTNIPSTTSKPPEPTAATGGLSQSHSSSGADTELREIYHLAIQSETARSNLGTLAAVVERIDHTREAIYCWQQVGRLLKQHGDTKRLLVQSDEFARRIERLVMAVQQLPPILGRPGLPGYRVIALARLFLTPELMNAMDAEQHDLLTRDWAKGEKVLLAHRGYVHGLFRSMRRQSLAGRIVRALRSALNDHPFLVGISALAFLASAVTLLAWLIR